MSSEHHHHHHDAHAHGEPHNHHHGHDHAQANEEYFDNQGIALLKSDEGRRLGAQAAQTFLNNYKFDKDYTRVLDFACGIGGSRLSGYID